MEEKTIGFLLCICLIKHAVEHYNSSIVRKLYMAEQWQLVEQGHIFQIVLVELELPLWARHIWRE